MPVISGTWKDIGLDPLPSSIAPRLTFRLSQPAVTPGGTLVLPVPKHVTPNVSSSFSVEVTRTDNLTPVSKDPDGVYIQIFGEWFEEGLTIPGWGQLLAKLRVPAEGGNIGDLVNLSVGYDDVYISTTAVESNVYVGFQLNSTTGDLYKRAE